MAAAGVATIAWAITTFQAKELVGSPFVWAGVLIAFFYGLYLVSVGMHGEVVAMSPRGLRKRLILVYLAYSWSVGLLFLSFHILLAKHPMPPAQSYTPWMVLAAIFSYVPFYLYHAKPAKLDGRSVVAVPIVYMVGVLLTTLMSIDLYNLQVEKVVTVGSVRDIRKAPSNFLLFRSLEIVPRQSLTFDYHETRDNSHTVTFYGLIPINTQRADTLFDAWIQVEYVERYDSDQSDSDIRSQEAKFFASCREKILGFAVDSVKYFDHSKLDNRYVLDKNNYPVIEGAIVLEPVYQPLEQHGKSKLINYFALLVITSLIFWGISAISDNT